MSKVNVRVRVIKDEEAANGEANPDDCAVEQTVKVGSLKDLFDDLKAQAVFLYTDVVRGRYRWKKLLEDGDEKLVKEKEDAALLVVKAAQGLNTTATAPTALASAQDTTAAQDVTADCLEQFAVPDRLPELDNLKPYVDQPLRDKKGDMVRLPVTRDLYKKHSASSAMERKLRPVGDRDASSLSELVSVALRAEMKTPTDEITIAVYLAKLVDDIWALMASALTSHSFDFQRNCSEQSLTKRRERPDIVLLVDNRVMLFKGEIKTRTKDMVEAERDLATKMMAWSANYHGKLEYLLCYAAAGTQVRFCALKRGETNNVEKVSPVFNYQSEQGRLDVIITAIKLFPLILLQAQELPSSWQLGATLNLNNGTTIDFVDDNMVLKSVDLCKQPELANKVVHMKKLYDDVAGCSYIVQLVKYHGVKRNVYMVKLQPIGKEISSDSPPKGEELIAAIRCILLALCHLHSKDWAHADIRWPNIIQETKSLFRLIDLEAAIPLNSRPFLDSMTEDGMDLEQRFPTAWGEGQEALEAGVFTSKSDLYMVGKLLEQAGSNHPDAEDLTQKLLGKELNVEQALKHSFFAAMGDAEMHDG